MRRVLTLGAIVLIATGLASSATWWWTRPRPLPAACVVIQFDHVSFLRQVDSQAEYTRSGIARLSASEADFDQRKVEYLQAKLHALEILGPLVERLVRTYGTDYICGKDPSQFVTMDLDYPTYAVASQREYIKRLEELEARLKPRWWLPVVTGLPGNLLATLVTLFGILLNDRREKAKDRRRIVVPDVPPQTR